MAFRSAKSNAFNQFDPIGIDTGLQEKARAAGGQPLTSWWLDVQDRDEFNRRAKEEFARISGSRMKFKIRPMTVGGAL